MLNIYYIGGSPCSGKSTIAKILSKMYDFYYFKADDYLDKCLQKGAGNGYTICKKLSGMSPEQIWMRDPLIQCQEEFLWYEEIFEFIMEDLNQINNCKSIIAEGAAFLPQLMKKLNIPYDKFISILPTEEFQISHYKERAFVSDVLEGCSDKNKAFDNWMRRDILFAEEVTKQCTRDGYLSYVNSGELSIEKMAEKVSKHFNLGK